MLTVGRFFPEVHGRNGRDELFYLYFEIWVIPFYRQALCD
ncbi:hypothetical protein NNO_1895 [Hydrogenimonas sp.]|nr:hypothetical protein NNO_1895 [Hydrogenimonas sp.]